MKKPELLSPAGTLTNLRYALAYGADAVYAGLPRYSLRVRNNDFNRLDNLQRGIDETHAAGKSFFLTVNVLPHDAKVRTFIADLEPVVAMGPDALIMADPGLIHLVRERWPEVPVHLSVQANTMNSASVAFWQAVGISRVILSRELSLDQIAEIRQRCPDMELEVFVHGALCIAYSGRCLLSGYFNHRDANQGTCTNACRWDYKVLPGTSSDSGDVALANLGDTVRDGRANQVYLLEEAERPGEYMPVEEDEHGTYIMNSKDLRAIQHVQRLVEMGIDSLKIEGRTKSYYYVGRATAAYRRAIDDAVSGKAFDPALLHELGNLANRGYTEGFYRRHAAAEHQNYEENNSDSGQQRYVGDVESIDSSGWATITVKNKFLVGDTLVLLTPTGQHRFRVEAMTDQKGGPLDEAAGGGWIVRIPLPVNEAPFGMLARELPQAEIVTDH